MRRDRFCALYHSRTTSWVGKCVDTDFVSFIIQEQQAEWVNARRQILRLLSFRSSEAGDKRAGRNSAPFVIKKTANWEVGGDKLLSFCTPFCRREAVVSGGTQRQIMVILCLVAQARSCPTKRKDKIWSFCILYQLRGTNSTVSGWCVSTDHFQIFAGSAGREVHWPNGVSLERN